LNSAKIGGFGIQYGLRRFEDLLDLLLLRKNHKAPDLEISVNDAREFAGKFFDVAHAGCGGVVEPGDEEAEHAVVFSAKINFCVSDAFLRDRIFEKGGEDW